MAQRKTAAEIIAFVKGYDFAEMSELRYQPSRYRIAIYVLGSDYYCCPSTGQKLPTANDEFNWQECGNAYGRKVYCSVANATQPKDRKEATRANWAGAAEDAAESEARLRRKFP